MVFQVDFQVRICEGESYILELTHQVRLNFATILVLGTTTLGYEILTSYFKSCNITSGFSQTFQNYRKIFAF